MNLTVPFKSFFIDAKISAVPIKIAICVSCPQACMIGTTLPLYSPSALEAKGMSTRSFTGSASISALRATTGPGFPPFRIPTTPVFPTPACTSIPRERRCTAIFSAVLNSLFPNSGFW